MALKNKAPSHYEHPDGDYVPAEITARKRVETWSRVSKDGDPLRIPGLGQPGFGRTCKQVFAMHVGMLDRNRPHGPLTGEHGFGPTQESIAKLTGVCVRTVKLAEQWLADPWTFRAVIEHEVARRGQKVTVRTEWELPADPRGKSVQGRRIKWTLADGLRQWPSFIQVFDAEKLPGGGGGRRRRICVHPIFYSATPDTFKACKTLPPWRPVDITKYDLSPQRRHKPTQAVSVDPFIRDKEQALIDGELGSLF